MPVTFDEKSHTYTSDKGRRFISVTTLIKKYVPPFDEHYWSTYKAVKEVMQNHSEWDRFKADCGGWENVVAHVRMKKSIPYREEMKVVKQRILNEWKLNAIEAAQKGTAFHKYKELQDTTSGLVLHEGKEHKVNSGDPLVAREFEERDGVFPELLIYDEELEIAGMSDWVLKVGDVISIKDYKTSKTVDKKGFMDGMLLHPVENMLNANFYIYSLQLSLYAYILERKGYKVGELTIEHIDRETHKTLDLYPTRYYKEEIEKLVGHYCGTKTKKAA